VTDGREHPAHPPVVHRHNEPIIVLTTVCTKDRKRILASADSAEAIVGAWNAAGSWRVGSYIIMPDHIHLFCGPADFTPKPLKQWVRYWKNIASRNWPRGYEQPIWQRDFWDTQLRRSENYSAKWLYVLDNAVRAKLVAHAQDWPFQGELNLLRRS
jgi:REP element-mobilizing transposase RayT